MDEMRDALKAKEAKRTQRKSNYPEAIRLLYEISEEIDPMRLLHLIAQHNPGAIIKAYNAAKA